MAHPPLEATHQIRLLYLHPGYWSDDLECDIRVVSLDESLAYAALSYAWEDGVPFSPDDCDVKSEIVCNGNTLTISPALGRALQSLRDEHHLRPLWIDKICINQDDDDEQQQQIAHMGRIFGDAERVLVWLGDSDNHTEAVWSLLHQARLLLPYRPSEMHQLAFRPVSSPDKAVIANCRQSKIAAVPPELARIPSARHVSWSHVKALLQRPWFSRAWTLQEVAVARLCYVMCGKSVMSWEDFCSAAFALQRGGYSDYILGPGVFSVILRDSERYRFASGQCSSLRSLLGHVRALTSREGHDKIFCLMSLISEITAARLPLMYGMTVADLYGEATRACILEDKHLAVLGEVEMRARDSGMPSWVPDWREKSPCRIMLNAWSADQQLYSSAGVNEPLILPSRSSDTLILRGRLIAPITKVLHMHARLNLNDLSVPEVSRDLGALRWSPGVWEGMYRGAVTRYRMPVSVARHPEHADALSAASHDRSNGLTASDMLAHALRRTVTADLYPRPRGRLSPNSIVHRYPAYAAWQAASFEGHAPASVLYEHDLAVKETLINRVAFIAGEYEDAYLGIGLRSLKEGDWICVLYGGHTPFILRPRYGSGEIEAEQCQQWSLTSECYVHGLMDAEAMDPDAGFPQRDFVLRGIPTDEPYTSKL